MEKKVLTKYTVGIQFIYRLLLPTASKLIWKLEINTKDPNTVNYKKLLKQVVKQTASDKAIQQINATRSPSQQQTKAVNQVVQQLQPTVSVTKEQQLVEPVVKSAKLETVVVDQLTKAFKKLSVNLLQQVQRQSYLLARGPYKRYSQFTGQQPPVNRLEDPNRPQNKKLPFVNVRAYAAGSRGILRMLIDVCQYYFNQNPLY